MELIMVNFSQVDNKGVKARATTLWNIKVIHHVYGFTNAQQRWDRRQQFSQVLSRCNALLIYALVEELLDIHRELQVVVSQLQCQSFCYAKM